jgi:hypothetical protein
MYRPVPVGDGADAPIAVHQVTAVAVRPARTWSSVSVPATSFWLRFSARWCTTSGGANEGGQAPRRRQSRADGGRR